MSNTEVQATRVLPGGIIDFGQWRVVESALAQFPPASVVQIRVRDGKLGMASAASSRGFAQGMARANAEDGNTLSLSEGEGWIGRLVAIDGQDARMAATSIGENAGETRH